MFQHRKRKIKRFTNAGDPACIYINVIKNDGHEPFVVVSTTTIVKGDEDSKNVRFLISIGYTIVRKFFGKFIMRKDSQPMKVSTFNDINNIVKELNTTWD